MIKTILQKLSLSVLYTMAIRPENGVLWSIAITILYAIAFWVE